MAIVYSKRIREATWHVDKIAAKGGADVVLYNLCVERDNDQTPRLRDVGVSYLSLAEAARAIETQRSAA